jgi:hypothetical protein
MALALKDRVQQTGTANTTVSFTLSGSVTGFQSFAVVGDTNTTYYAATEASGSWEVGIGTYSTTGPTLTRTTILASSNAGSAVTFSGTVNVFVTLPSTFIRFEQSENTTAPNATVYVSAITSSAGSTNADVAIVAKGTGATTAQVADSTATGGNKRGQYATDWQKSRSAAAQVASGLYSFIGSGDGNRASGNWSVIGGGFVNTVNQSSAAVLGGQNNTASAGSSIVGGGDSNTASGGFSAIVGGANNLADASYSFVSGGSLGTTRGIIGYHVFPACYGIVGFTAGLSQSGLLLVGTVTTNATATVLTSDGSAASTNNQVILPNNSAYYVKGSIIANVTGASNTKSWDFIATIKRGANAAATSIVGVVALNVQAADAGASAWAVAITANTTNGGLAVTVTGQASTTIRWVCKLETTEVTY